MLNPQLASATDLHAWAHRLESQSVFPRLVRGLLAASGVVRGLSIRSGEGVVLPGWDGRFEVLEGHSVLPPGQCQLEMGTGSEVRAKAQGDYAKRTAATSEDVRANTTFVFATPRRWGKRDDWVAERRAEGQWRSVVALDADDIEALLDTAPGVHVWISELLGKRPLEVRTLESWWKSWSSQTAPPIPAALLVAGREKQRDELINRLADGGVVGLRAESRQEAIAFAAAAVATTSDDSDPLPHSVVVDSSTAWAILASSPPSALLIPTFEAVDVAAATSAGHTVLIPAGAEDSDSGAMLKLPRLGRREASKALVAAGLPRPRAEVLAVQARLNLLSVVRQLALNPRQSKPEWARDSATHVARLLLCGSWSTDNPADSEAVAQLAGCTYPEIEESLSRWTASEDPPLRRSGRVWRLAAPLDVWSLVGRSLSRSDMERWQGLAFAVLTEPDPALDLPADQHAFAAIYGMSRRWSPALRLGLAQGVALLGNAGDERLADGSSAGANAHEMVHRILAQANEDPTGRRWQSLADILPLLAEAAPEAFLRGCEDALQKPDDLLKTLFLDDAQNRWGASPHTGMLWALEGLAWSSALLPRVTHVLAGLTAVDPGGTWSNRPSRSLTTIFLPWHPGTLASPTQRLETIRGLIARVPDIGWTLLVSVLPGRQGVAFLTHRPRFRDWAPDDEGTTIREFTEATGDLYDLAFELVDQDPRRWLSLLERIADAPKDALDRGLRRLERSTQAGFDGSVAFELWGALRDLTAKHRAYPEAKWSLEDADLARLEAVEATLKPTRTSLASAYLFDSLPDLPNVDKLKMAEYEQRLQELRHSGINGALAEEGFDGLVQMAQRCTEPWLVGVSAAEAAGEAIAKDILNGLPAPDHQRVVALGWVARMRALHGGDWARAFAERLTDAPPETRVGFCQVLPQEPVTWELVDHLAAEERVGYWDGLRVQWVASEHVTAFAARATNAGRPFLAMEILSHNGLGPTEDRSARAQAIVDAMMAALRASESTPSPLSGWSIARLLDLLEEADIDLRTMATLELGFEDVTHFDRPPRAVHGAMLAEPSLFVEAVLATYRPEEGAELAEPTEADRRRAGVLYTVLTSLRTVPGAAGDDTIDRGLLRAWVEDARRALAEAKRSKIGDHCIGEVFSSSPVGGDGAWPAEPIRDLIESIASPDLESGIQIGHYNSRGVTSRDPYEGGSQEELLVRQFEQWAEQVGPRWPRTGSLLRAIADSYRRDGGRFDMSAEELSEE